MKTATIQTIKEIDNHSVRVMLHRSIDIFEFEDKILSLCNTENPLSKSSVVKEKREQIEENVLELTLKTLKKQMEEGNHDGRYDLFLGVIDNGLGNTTESSVVKIDIETSPFPTKENYIKAKEILLEDENLVFKLDPTLGFQCKCAPNLGCWEETSKRFICINCNVHVIK